MTRLSYKSERPQAGHFFSSGLYIRNSNEAAQNQLKAGSKHGRAWILLFIYQQRLLEVAAGSEYRPCGELTSGWNRSLLGAPNPPSLPTWFTMLGSVHWSSCGWGARSLSLLSHCALSASQTPYGQQVRRSMGCKGFCWMRPKPKESTRSLCHFIFFLSSIYAQLPLCFSYLIRVGYFFPILKLNN